MNEDCLEMKTTLRYCLVTLLWTLGMCGALAQTTPQPSVEKISNSTLTHTIISSPGGGFGYDIYSDKKLLIHQPHVPGMPGNAGFKTKADSEKVAAAIINKIKNGVMPPTITQEELKKLGVID